MSKRKLRSVYRKYLFSYSFDTLEPIRARPIQMSGVVRIPPQTALKK